MLPTEQLSIKREKHYSIIMGWLRCRLSFALLFVFRAAVLPEQLMGKMSPLQIEAGFRVIFLARKAPVLYDP